MKKIYLTMIIVIVVTSAFAQWTEVFDCAQPLNSVFFVDENTGYVIGDNGTILKTVDAGLTWTDNSFVTSRSLSKVHFASPDTGYIVGGSPGIILKTVNGGLDWSLIYNHSKQLNALFFIDANAGYVAGNDFTILKTTNGGMTWDTLMGEIPGYNVNAAFFTDYNTGYLLLYSGEIYKTINAGSNWSETIISSPYGNTWGFRTIDFVTADTGYVGGSSSMPLYFACGIVYKTVDAGNTWEVNTMFGPFQDLHFPDNLNGYAISQEYNGLPPGLIKTIDGGLNWELFENDYQYTSVFFTSVDTGFLTTSEGKILKTTTGGVVVGATNTDKPSGDAVIYPNPFTNNLNCHYRLDNKSDVSITVYDILGRIKASWKEVKGAGEYDTMVDLQGLQKGLYLLEIKINDQSVTKKIIKHNQL